MARLMKKQVPKHVVPEALEPSAQPQNKNGYPPRTDAELKLDNLVAIKMERSGLRFCLDTHSYTCLEVGRSAKQVKYVSLDPAGGLYVAAMRTAEFDTRFKTAVGYQASKALRSYLGYGTRYGATEEVLTLFAQAIEVTAEERRLCLVVRRAATAEAAPMTEAVKTRLRERATEAKQQKAPRAESAAAMFKRLIMEGKLTEKEIFKQVQLKHHLADDKFSYVKWYHKWLQKDGQTPPKLK